MAEARSRFMDSADRLDGVVRTLKTRQIEEHQGTQQYLPSRMTAESPDELWAKQFATQCIGPVCFKVAPGADMPLPPLTQALQGLPPSSQSSYAPKLAVPAQVAEAPMKTAASQHIGAVLGKPRRRGLFARMFSRA
ncbi:MAG TPA: hypothetical protein VG867_03715 [Rhizomicrobium sp.]|nr:hypothetical protein [Rhizomicrobium sp.]